MAYRGLPVYAREGTSLGQMGQAAPIQNQQGQGGGGIPDCMKILGAGLGGAALNGPLAAGVTCPNNRRRSSSRFADGIELIPLNAAPPFAFRKGAEIGEAAPTVRGKRKLSVRIASSLHSAEGPDLCVADTCAQ